MTPREKALQLVEAYWEKIIHDDDGDRHDMCKQCALIAVDEIMDYLNKVMIPNPFVQYWNEVKTEIEKL